jgi:hypothetical protein
VELARRIRWLALIAPVALAALLAVGQPAPPGVVLAARAQSEATARPPVERPCQLDALPSGVRSGHAWYHLDPVLDASGTLAGQQLTVGVGRNGWTVPLPPESFASGPVGGRILVGDDDGQRSRLRTIDALRGCWTAIGMSSDVIRSAVLTQDGSRAFEHRVERSTRRDLGIWERDLATGGADAVPLMAGLQPDTAYGPTFTTSVLSAPDGRIMVSSCGEFVCRTRVADPRTGQVATTAGTGPGIGLAGQRLVALAACRGLPCEIDSVDIESGVVFGLGETDGTVVVAPDAQGAVVFAAPRGIGILRPGAEGHGTEVSGSAGLAPIAATSIADSGAEAPGGLVAVAPGGRVSDPGAIRFLDPTARSLSAAEVLR